MFIAALITFVLGAALLQGIKKIPSKPSHLGQATLFGAKVPGVVYEEGWSFYPGYPYWHGFIPVKMEKVNFDVVSEKTRTPDEAESQVPGSLTFTPHPLHLIAFIDSGGEEGVKKILIGEFKERVREWAYGSEEGPQTWQELNQSQLEAISVLVRKIAGPQLTVIPDYAQAVPTWIWLRYYDEPRATKLLKSEKPWARNKWKRVRDVLEKIENEHGLAAITALMEAVKGRRKEIEGLRSGHGEIVLPSLGIKLERMNIGDINVLGEVGIKAEQQAKEELERKAEEVELQHVTRRVVGLMKPVNEGGAGMPLEMAVEQLRLSTKQATMVINAHKHAITIDETTGKIIEAVVGKVINK